MVCYSTIQLQDLTGFRWTTTLCSPLIDWKFKNHSNTVNSEQTKGSVIDRYFLIRFSSLFFIDNHSVIVWSNDKFNAFQRSVFTQSGEIMNAATDITKSLCLSTIVLLVLPIRMFPYFSSLVTPCPTGICSHRYALLCWKTLVLRPSPTRPYSKYCEPLWCWQSTIMDFFISNSKLLLCRFPTAQNTNLSKNPPLEIIKMARHAGGRLWRVLHVLNNYCSSFV